MCLKKGLLSNNKKGNKMKRIAALFVFLAISAFSENLVLENETAYPIQHKQSRMAIQWAASAKEVQEHNQVSIQGTKLNSGTLQAIGKQGQSKLSIPKNAEYFRVVVWLKGEGSPAFITNWVEVVPNKIYQLKSDHLIPAVLMSGMGC